MLVHVGSQDWGLGTPSRYLAGTISWNAYKLLLQIITIITIVVIIIIIIIITIIIIIIIIFIIVITKQCLKLHLRASFRSLMRCVISCWNCGNERPAFAAIDGGAEGCLARC